MLCVSLLFSFPFVRRSLLEIHWNSSFSAQIRGDAGLDTDVRLFMIALLIIEFFYRVFAPLLYFWTTNTGTLSKRLLPFPFWVVISLPTDSHMVRLNRCNMYVVHYVFYIYY